jgi:predicted transcriptional regulator
VNQAHFDSCQFDNRRIRPVSSKTQISWQDFASMQVFTRKVQCERRLPTPAWALNDELLRQVIVRYVERRAYVHNPNLPLRERLSLAAAAIKKQHPKVRAMIDRLSEEYRECKDAERRRKLEIEIEGLDTFLRITERDGGAAFAASVAYLYFRAGKSSVGVGDELGLKPPHVRMIIYRLNQCWDAIQNPKPKRVNGGPKFDLKLAVELRERGQSFGTIGEQLGVSGSVVHYWIAENRPDLRVVRVQKPPRVFKTEFDYALAVELRRRGMPSAKVARLFGVAVGSMHYAMKKAKGRNLAAPAQEPAASLVTVHPNGPGQHGQESQCDCVA